MGCNSSKQQKKQDISKKEELSKPCLKFEGDIEQCITQDCSPSSQNQINLLRKHFQKKQKDQPQILTREQCNALKIPRSCTKKYQEGILSKSSNIDEITNINYLHKNPNLQHLHEYQQQSIDLDQSNIEDFDAQENKKSNINYCPAIFNNLENYNINCIEQMSKSIKI